MSKIAINPSNLWKPEDAFNTFVTPEVGYAPPEKSAWEQMAKFGDWICISGQTPTSFPPPPLHVVGTDMRTQMTQVFENLKRATAEAGIALKDINYLWFVFVTGHIDEGLAALREVVPKYFTRPFPAATIIEVSRLAWPGQFVEIEPQIVSVKPSTREAVNPERVFKPEVLWDPQAPAASCWEQCSKSGDLISISGQKPLSADGKLIWVDVQNQVRHALDNMKETIQAAGADLNDLVYLGWFFLAGYMDEGLAAMRRLLPSYLRSPYPTMNAMEVSRLARSGQLVEVEGTAFLGAARRKKAINPAKLMKPGQLWDLYFPIGAGKTTSKQSCWEQGLRYQNWIFVSGQLPVASNGRLWGKDLRTQVQKVHENIREVVKAGGGKFDRDVIYIGWFSQTLNMEQSLAAARDVILSLYKSPFPTALALEAPRFVLPEQRYQSRAIAYIYRG
jgi:2-iminobutanoate/2-iminopropanoate deaminase